MTTLSRSSPPTDLHLAYVATAVLVVLGCLAMLASALFTSPTPPAWRARPAATRLLAPPRPDDPAVLLNNTPLAIAPADAVAINAARRLDRMRLTAAPPFQLPAALAGANDAAAVDCLTKAVYYEAASESDAGERAVAQVVLNRVRSPLFPHSVCGVVFEGAGQRTGCQFSFTCDGSLTRSPSLAGWARARRIALAALAGRVERSVGLSTHYHANYVVPYWASSLDKVATIGAHIFYTMRGSRGRPFSFREAYDGAAERPPALALNAAQLDSLAGASSGGEVTGAASPPHDRTVVREDALGALAAPQPKAAAPAGTLRADDAAGELLADTNRGVLNRAN